MSQQRERVPPGTLPSDLRRVVLDGCAWAGMMGFGEHLFQAMVLSLALGERAAAMAAVIPAFLGATAQLSTAWLARRFGSHKRVVQLGSWVQVASLTLLSIGCAMMASGVIERLPLLAVLGVLSLYQWGGLAGGAAWTAWMGSVVPSRLRGGFFSMRTRWIYVVQLCTLLAAGGLLTFSDEKGLPLWGFAGAMLIAACCRAVSATLIGRTREPREVHQQQERGYFRQIIVSVLATPSAGLIGCYLLMALSQNLAVPFLIPMALGPLNEPVQSATLVLGSMMLGRILGFLLLPAMLKSHGPQRTWRTAAVILVPVFLLPVAWPSLPAVLVMHAVAGIGYAWWEMTTWLQILDRTPQHERTRSMSLLYFGTWLASYVGGTLGAALLEQWRVGGAAVTPSAFALGGYQAVFVASSIARLATLIPIWLWVRRAGRA